MVADLATKTRSTDLIQLLVIADSAALTGLTFDTHRSDRSDQSSQNAKWTSPLRRSRRDDQNAYVERPVRSPDEGVMVLARTSPAPDRSDRWARRSDRCSQPNPS
jgi:hypothetical protein